MGQGWYCFTPPGTLRHWYQIVGYYVENDIFDVPSKKTQALSGFHTFSDNCMIKI
jgi:hypothetical protein